MKNIGEFLDRFKKLGIPNEKVRISVSKILEDELKMPIAMSDVSVKNHVAYVRCGGLTRSEIFLKKKAILEKISKTEGLESIVDIR